MTYFKKIAAFKDSSEFRGYLREIGAKFDLVDKPRIGADSMFSKPCAYKSKITGRTVNLPTRWALLPMEGWDCLPNGAPSELARRRWLRSAGSGAGIFFGCEAVAVMASAKSRSCARKQSRGRAIFSGPTERPIWGCNSRIPDGLSKRLTTNDLIRTLHISTLCSTKNFIATRRTFFETTKSKKSSLTLLKRANLRWKQALISST